jgi:hypothetical protein
VPGSSTVLHAFAQHPPPQAVADTAEEIITKESMTKDIQITLFMFTPIVCLLFIIVVDFSAIRHKQDEL